uniref:Secretogranin-3 n=1 Tax=Periophthalmus magnuspinnatus TaxID=409849 RepID=A0A3B3ZNE7_9GOBI
KTVYNRQLTEEKPLIDQSKDTAQDNDDFSALKSLAEGQKSKMESEDVPDQSSQKSDRFVPDESDSTKNRRLAEDYDSTKNGMSDGKYQDVPESFRQVDGTPLTAEDIVQKIANKIYEEDDRGVFDRIVSRLLKLGLITDSEADSLEYQVAEALQKLITKNAQDEEEEGGEEREEGAEEEKNMEDGEGDDGGDMTGDERWDRDAQNEVSPNDGLQDLQYFPNFYRLLRSLDSRDTQERETLITIMKTLIDFVKMMVKYGTITPEEGVSYLNLDAMIALQTKNKLGKSLKSVDEDDNTKAEAAKMQKEYENLKDSTKEEQPSPDTRPGKSETYLEAIRKNIEWLKKHSKEEGKDYDLSKLKDFMDQQVDSYIEKGIISKDEGGTIKRIYSSL